MKSIREGVTIVVQELVDAHGGVKAAQLVEAARPEESPAHNGFEWDDSKAGEEYRLIQSRNWLRVVRVIHEEREERLWHVPANTSHEEDGNEGIYRTQRVLVTIPDELERALSQASASLRAAARAVDELRAAVDADPSPDRSALVVQISRGLEIMQSALDRVH